MSLVRTLRVSGLAAKLAVCVIASTAAFFSLFGFLNLRMERSFSSRMVQQAGERIADIILRSTRYQMLNNDTVTLHRIVQDIGSEQGIQRIRVINKDGRITLSTRAGEIGAVADYSAWLKPGVKSGPATREFTENGQHLLGVTRPIANSKDCSSAACHVHAPSQPVLGVIDASLSLKDVDEQTRQNQATLLWFLFGAILFGSVAAVIFMWIVVYRPVKELINGTHRVAGGDLGYRLPVRSDDELGDLAASFNKMTAEVAGVQSKIEEQVRRKTADLERAHKSLLNSEKMASVGKLAATVAHEINNPLFGILTYARLIARGLMKQEFEGRDELTEQLQTIERESKRCGDLVKSLLTFSRQAPSNREPNDLNTIAGRAVALVRHKLEMQSVELVQNFAADMPPAHRDANQIHRHLLARWCQMFPLHPLLQLHHSLPPDRN